MSRPLALGRSCSPLPASLIAACIAAIVCIHGVTAKLDAGAGCHNAKDHCDAPKSSMGCCVSNSKCYKNLDCTSFLKTCPFSNDTKKAESLGRCVPDKPPEFTKAACTSETMAKANTTDGKDIPLASKVSCFTSEKVTCQVFRNATNHTFVAAQCTEAAKKASTAQASSTWCIHTYLLMALLLSAGFVAVLGRPF